MFFFPGHREPKKKAGKSSDKKKSSAEKERISVGGNESFKSREFISSDSSDNESDRGKKSSKRKVRWWPWFLGTELFIKAMEPKLQEH